MLMQNRRKRYALDQSPFYRLANRQKLATLVGLTASELRQLTKHHDTLYKEFPVPKKDGGLRGVENPHRVLKMAQAKIARILSQIQPPNYLFCPVKGRCYVSNAAQHRNHRVVRCLDIRKYYPSTPSRRVYWFFNNIMKCAPDIAATLTSLGTYHGHLPTGSPLSPILAYFSFYDLWEQVAELCGKHGYTLTVYIDDVTISGTNLAPAVIWGIKRAIHRAGLRYHKEKHYIDRPAEITGVIVDGERLIVPHRQLKKLHATKQDLHKTTDKAAASKLESRISGMMGQISQIQKMQGLATAQPMKRNFSARPAS